MKRHAISPRAKTAGMTPARLRRVLSVIALYRRRTEILHQRAEAVTAEIRGKQKGFIGAMPNEWREDRDGLREDAELLRADVREMGRLLRLVLHGRFSAAKNSLDRNRHSPWDCVSRILGPTVNRGLGKFRSSACHKSDYRAARVMRAKRKNRCERPYTRG